MRQVSTLFPVLKLLIVIRDDGNVEKIINNYAGGNDISRHFSRNAMQAYENYNGYANYDPINEGEYYFGFR